MLAGISFTAVKQWQLLGVHRRSFSLYNGFIAARSSSKNVVPTRHSSTAVRNRLNELFDNRLISRFCTHAWPPRSPDLTPLDFFLWGRIKGDVFSSECESVEDMTSRIRAAFDKLREECTQDGDLLPRVHKETAWRAQMCEEVRGQHIENRGLRRDRERRN